MLLVQAQAYRQQYRINAIYLLPVNLYGPGDNFNHKFASSAVKKFVRRWRPVRRASMSGDRRGFAEFLYVEDAAEGIALAAERYDKPDPVNLGAGFEITIRDLATLIADLTGFTGEIVWDTTKPDGQPRRCLDVSRAEREFGFRAKTSFEDGLKATVEWYRQAVREGRT